MILLNSLNLLKVAAVTPELNLANISVNKSTILSIIDELSKKSCHVVVFPELCLTGATSGDLFLQSIIQEQSLAALIEISDFLRNRSILVTVGYPMKIGGDIFNCLALINQDGIQGISVKSRLSECKKRNEQRWFKPGPALTSTSVEIEGKRVPIGSNLKFQPNNPYIQAIELEIGEISSEFSPKNPTLVLNPCADNATIGSLEEKRSRLLKLSGQSMCIYVSASSGPNESSTDDVFSGQSLIAASGKIVGETKCFEFSTQIAIAKINLKELIGNQAEQNNYLKNKISSKTHSLWNSYSSTKMPFVPSSFKEKDQAYHQAFQIQVTGLARRLRATRSQSVTIGMSGGLDSSLAFLVCVHAFQKLGLSTKGINAVFMPGPGTTQRSRANCQRLVNFFDVSFKEIPISEAFYSHLKDIGHPGLEYDLTYENAQARERTQILMDLASIVGGFVVGTGDMSELALGWCTYNGDQMSMYNVNAGIPKTFLKEELEWYGKESQNAEVACILNEINSAPISPELLPLNVDQSSPQKTEDQIGPYILHDFFLYHTLNQGLSPDELFLLSVHVFSDTFDQEEIIKWMGVFYKRFITQRFKHSAMPDGPSVFSIGLSPRGCWVMPSDADPQLWLESLERIKTNLNDSTEGKAYG